MSTAELPVYEWKDLPWHKIQQQVYRLQKRIFKASRRGDVKTVHRLERLLMKSWAARCLAVRRVTQDNAGKKVRPVMHCASGARYDSYARWYDKRLTPFAKRATPLITAWLGLAQAAVANWDAAAARTCPRFPSQTVVSAAVVTAGAPLVSSWY
jgi:hypothetical protein